MVKYKLKAISKLSDVASSYLVDLWWRFWSINNTTITMKYKNGSII